MQIKRTVDQLACLTDQFPGYQGVTTFLVSAEELDAVSRLSGDIMTSLDKIALLREQRPHIAEAHTPMQSSSSSSSSSSDDQVHTIKLVWRHLIQTSQISFRRLTTVYLTADAPTDTREAHLSPMRSR